MKKALPVFFLIILALLALFIKHCRSQQQTPVTKTTYTKPKSDTRKNQSPNTTGAYTDARGLNRNPSLINYSKHARCRMDCRHISEQEVKQILHDGKINYRKSELQGDDCHKKYAVEGITNDNQTVRIIFAPCSDEVTVVTVIDLGKEWACDCK